MRRIALAAAMVLAATAARAECGNLVFNITRATECRAYTNDWNVQKDLLDKRGEAIAEWVAKYPASGQTLDLVIKEANYRSTNALARDLKMHSDKDMYASRGCASLPVCVGEKKEAEEAAEPPKRKYCGPRDRARGRCR